TQEDWLNFLSGKTLINPEKNIDNLKNKKLIVAQGADDDVIQSEHTAEYVKELQNAQVNVNLLLIRGVGHGGDLEEKTVQIIIDNL
ncbi:MAG: hypothetical protein UT31_C0002G0023, partial [Parcubacteria group bacterium GW2011_GWF2_39_13b]